MPVPHCRHIKEDGIFCQCPALSGRSYCHAHLKARGRQMRMAREARKQRLRPLWLPLLEDLPAVQVAILQILEARAADRISDRTMALMLWALQQAGSNLKFMTSMAASVGAGDPQAERPTEYPQFEAEFGLPASFDLEQPPEAAFPPQPESPAQAEAQTPIAVDPEAVELVTASSSSSDLVTPEDVELEEILVTQGQAAYQRRFAEVDANRKKQQRKVDQARWLLEATRRNYDVVHRDTRPREFYEQMQRKHRPAQQEIAAAPEPATAGS